MNLLELIAAEMQSDDEDSADQSDRLERLYDGADDNGKQLIDDALICICGWSLPSLRSKL